MPATANARGRRIAGQLLTGRAVEKRRSSNSDARPSTCISSKVAPSSASIARHKLNEAEVIRRAQGGDQLMFDHLYRSHSRRVYALCLRMVGNTTDAEDLAQEVFLLLLRKIHTFRGDSAFSTWLHRLTVNLVLMHLRKKPLPVVSIEANPDLDENAGSLTIDIGAPDLLLEGSIDRINLERCIEQLPAGYRTMFVLHDIEGYQHIEIAEILGRSIGVSKSQLHKARTRLRELLQEFRRERARDERMTAVKMRSRSTEVYSFSTHSVRKDEGRAKHPDLNSFSNQLCSTEVS
jgi:RNA polymerase sigma-70 factor (ECF subfamily)